MSWRAQALRTRMVVGLALVLTAAAAHAAPKKTVVLKVTGDAIGDKERGALTEAFKKELTGYPTVELLPTPEVDLIDLMFDAECVEPDEACLADIGKSQGAEQIIFGEVAAKGGGYELTTTLVDVKTKKKTGGTSKSAPTASGLTQAAPGIATALFGAKPQPKAQLVALSVTSTPDGADVFVNGHALGRTPARFEGKPGSYTIRVVKDGFEEQARTVELVDKAVELGVKLVEKAADAVAVVAPVTPPTTPVDDEEEFYETWWFWTIVGVGAAGATVGILAGAGAFEAEPAPVGNATLLVGQRPDQDFLLQLQRK